jgi:hypothetical protein
MFLKFVMLPMLPPLLMFLKYHLYLKYVMLLMLQPNLKNHLNLMFRLFH